MTKHLKLALLVSLLGAVTLSGCAGFRARENLRQGVLSLELSQQDVLNTWGAPTHTTAMSGDQVIKAGIAGWGGFFFKGRQMYEIWDYTPRAATLVFYDRELVAWKTGQTVQQLALPQPDYPLYPKNGP